MGRSVAARAKFEKACLLADNLGRQVEAVQLLQRSLDEMHACLHDAQQPKAKSKNTCTNCIAELEKLETAMSDAEVKLVRLKRITPDSLPLMWVRTLFDGFADHFDFKLCERLAYRAPEILCKAILAQRVEKTASHSDSVNTIESAIVPRFDSCCDLGAGTGLMGQLLRSHCSRLEGVELSEKMASEAERKGIYDTMHVGDLHGYLENNLKCCDTSRKFWDLLVACDVFVYIGCLRKVFGLVESSMGPQPDALFCFTTEIMEARTAKQMQSFRLNDDGRYEYTPGYIALLAQESGLRILHRSEAVLRKNFSFDVPGHVWVLGRQSSSQ